MKRILICGILSLAAVGMAFAQWPDGFSVSGEMKTGVRADFFTADKAMTSLTDEQKSTLSFWNDDAGNRVQLVMEYKQDNYGFKFVPRWIWTGDSDDPTIVRLPNAYGWFDFLNHMVKVTAGNIDDGVWVSPTPHDVSYSNGNGTLRFEVMPIDGLSVGWALGRNILKPGPSSLGENPITNTAKAVIGSSSFGAKYASEMFTIAAGLELRSEQNSNTDSRISEGYGDWGGRGSPMSGMLTSNGLIPLPSFGGANGTIAKDEVATSAYVGVEVKPVQGLTVQLGAEAANIDSLDWNGDGYLWLNEKIAYDLGGITPRLTMHQRLWITETQKDKWSDPDTLLGGDKGETYDQYPAYLEFVPGVDFAVADNLNAYVEIPVRLVDKFFDIGVKPGVDYSFGPGFSLGAYYQFILSGSSYEITKDNDPGIRNVVQFNFTWSF